MTKIGYQYQVSTDLLQYRLKQRKEVKCSIFSGRKFLLVLRKTSCVKACFGVDCSVLAVHCYDKQGKSAVSQDITTQSWRGLNSLHCLDSPVVEVFKLSFSKGRQTKVC